MEGITGVKKARALGAEGARVLTCLPPGRLSPRVKEGDVRCSAAGVNLEGYISRLTGASPGYVIILQDVTEKKKIEEELFQATKHASVGRLAAGVSHEVGNPLASISSLVQELLAEEQTPFGRDSLDTISLHIVRIVRIVRSLGDFARINPRKKEQTSLAETLESTLALVRFDKNFKTIRIQTDIQPVPLLYVDPDQLQQVFLNLVLNARDAMPEGGDLRISLRRVENQVEIAFSDTGEGVDSSIRGKVFDPFFTTKGPTRGTGLGLGVSYGIIKDHGGTIEMSPGGGQGAGFVIRLPIGGGSGKGS
jgi:signal transduction histidine kinase